MFTYTNSSMNGKLLFFITTALSLMTLAGCSNGLNKSTKSEALTNENTENETNCLFISNYITHYKVGDVIDYSGIKVYEAKEDGSLINIAKSCTFEPSAGTVLNTIGEQTIKVKKDSSVLTGSFKVEVGDNIFVAIRAEQYKEKYWVGEKFDVSSVVIKGTTWEGKEEVITSKCKFSRDPDSTFSDDDIGNENITVSYSKDNLKCDYTINIDSMSDFVISDLNDLYLINQPIDYSNVLIECITTSGDYVDITNECSFSIPQGTVFDSVGTHQAIIRHDSSGKIYSFTITIVESFENNIAWRESFVFEDIGTTTPYELAKTCDEVIIGKASKYKSEIQGLKQHKIGETESDQVYMYYKTANNCKKLYVLSSGTIVFEDDDHEDGPHNLPTNPFYDGCFCGFVATKLVLENLDTSKMTDTAYMFCDCVNLVSLDLTNIDLSSSTKMKMGFCSLTNLKQLIFPKVNSSKLKEMPDLFGLCTSLESINLTNFDTSNCTDMSLLFFADTALKNVTFGGYFNTSKVTNFNQFFYQCKALTSLDLSSFDTRKAISMRAMFQNCTNLTTLNKPANFIPTGCDTSYMYTNCPLGS